MKTRLYRLIGAGALFVAGLLTEGALSLVLLMAAYALAGYDVLWHAVRNLFGGQVFDENLLMSIATVGAVAIGEYPEAVAVMLFYQLGELFQDHAVDRSRRSIAELMDLKPDWANRLVDGVPTRVTPQEVAPGDLILVRPGEKVPLDGVILEGVSTLDTAMLTGESQPLDVAPGRDVYSGSVNLLGPLTIEVQKPYEQSTAARILDLVENASSRKSRSENFITRFSAVYTPVVVILAALLAVVPPLVTGQPFTDWVYRALQFLVVSCPCALVISIPLSFFGGIGGASRHGILVKGGNYLETLAQVRTVVFDKTGTLTHGRLSVSGVHPQGMSEEHLLRLAAHAEAHSNHPIARAVLDAWTQKPDLTAVSDVLEQPGLGISAQFEGKPLLAGNQKWLLQHGITAAAPLGTGSAVHIAWDGQYAGYVLTADTVKPTARAAIDSLRRAGVKHIAMLSGDSPNVVKALSQELGIPDSHHSLMPQDKVARVDEMLAAQQKGQKLCFVGDGINDAPVLARADVGVAMGALGSEAAIEAADIVLMDDDPRRLPLAIAIARKTVGIARQNAFFAIGVKVLVLALSALGYTTLWAAVFADVGVAALAVINAMRTLRKHKDAV